MSVASIQQLAYRRHRQSIGLCRCGRLPASGLSNCASCIEKTVARKRRRMAVLREQVYTHYGDRCACQSCKTNIRPFFTIDHITGGGRNHLKKIGCGINFYRWIVNNQFPADLQILCWNCNCAKSSKGHCPHTTATEPANTQQRYRAKMRQCVFDYYGGQCFCCGEPNFDFLTVDHLHNDGAAHRTQIRYTCSMTLYRWIIANSFPDNIAIACWNCNISRYLYGICPHKAQNV